MTTNPLKLEISSNIATLTLNRPKVHNAVNLEMMNAFEQHLDEIAANADIRSIILTAGGSTTFCAGGDLKYFATLKTREACLKMSRRMQTILERLYLGKRVVIAAINGQALGGGCEISTACHIRFAASHAAFAFRQAPNGIITGWGGGRRLLQMIGKSRALQLLLTGEKIDAEEAFRIGLIDKIVDAEKLLPTAIEFAEKINQNPPSAVAAFLELSQKFANSNQKSLEQFETEKFADLWMEADFQALLKKILGD